VSDAVEGYAVGAYDEAIPCAGTDVRSQSRVSRDCRATYGVSEDGRRGEDKHGTQNCKEKQDAQTNRYGVTFQENSFNY
jgi:hypothetical protein